MSRRGPPSAAVVLALLPAGCGGGAASGDGPGAAMPDRTVEGFGRPTAAVHDPMADVYLVAHTPAAAGAAGGPDGGARGCIARLQPDGRCEPRWIAAGPDGTALHEPCGLQIAGERLLVADRDRILVFERATGAPRGTLRVPGASRLADLALDPDGGLWILDEGAVHLLAAAEAAAAAAETAPEGGSAAEVRTVARDAALARPGAIDATAAGAYVVTGDGAFLQVDARGRITELVRLPSAALAGVLRVEPGRWLCADRSGGTLHAIDTLGAVRPLPGGTGLAGPGDFGFDRARRRLLVPLAGSGAVRLQALPQVAAEPASGR